MDDPPTEQVPDAPNCCPLAGTTRMCRCASCTARRWPTRFTQLPTCCWCRPCLSPAASLRWGGCSRGFQWCSDTAIVSRFKPCRLTQAGSFCWLSFYTFALVPLSPVPTADDCAAVRHGACGALHGRPGRHCEGCGQLSSECAASMEILCSSASMSRRQLLTGKPCVEVRACAGASC